MQGCVLQISGKCQAKALCLQAEAALGESKEVALRAMVKFGSHSTPDNAWHYIAATNAAMLNSPAVIQAMGALLTPQASCYSLHIANCFQSGLFGQVKQDFVSVLRLQYFAKLRTSQRRHNFPNLCAY